MMKNTSRFGLKAVIFASLVVLCIWRSTASDSFYHYYYRYYDENNRLKEWNYLGVSKKNDSESGDGPTKAAAALAADHDNWANVRHAKWVAANKKYQEYLSASNTYYTSWNTYLSNVERWSSAVGKDGVGVDITDKTLVDGSKTKKIVQKLSSAHKWPEFSNASTYRDYCKAYPTEDGKIGGTLSCPNLSGSTRISYSYTGKDKEMCYASKYAWLYTTGEYLGYRYVASKPIVRTLTSIDVSGGYVGEDIYPFDASVKDNYKPDSAVLEAEKGSVILIGTADKPIKINGPVWVDGDVVIRGFVSGQGSIYAGRNIHIIGDIVYLNPPNWPHGEAELKKAENSPENVAKKNRLKDLLLLAARGNIIVGDYTAQNWTNASQMAYLNLSGRTNKDLPAVVNQESDIGYSTSFSHNYTATDGGKTVIDGNLDKYVEDHTDEDQPRTLESAFLSSARFYVRRYAFGLKAVNRKYYESAIGGFAVQQLKQTTLEQGAPSWRGSPTWWTRVLATLGFVETSHTTAVGSTTAYNTDAGDVTQIDAFLYANHGIFGVAGGTTTKKLHLNGGMICRDEGLLTSFAGRFSGDSSAKAWINWDMRIKSDSREGLHVGAPEESSEDGSTYIKRITWYLE